MKRLILSMILLLTLTACHQDAVPETIPTTLPPTTEAQTEATSSPTEETEPEGPYLTQLDSSKVCVGIIPTRVGSMRYIEIADQNAAAAAFEKAASSIYSNEWWIKGDKTIGLTVAYKGEFWDFVDSGELVNALGRAKAEDAADLYALCFGAAVEAGWGNAVVPEQLQGIVSATLYQENVSVSLTDSASLSQLEAYLTSGKFSLGGTGCPFSVLLDLELATGDTATIALATDSCGVWMSEGNYYEFASDSQPLFDLFGVTFEFVEMKVK